MIVWSISFPCLPVLTIPNKNSVYINIYIHTDISVQYMQTNEDVLLYVPTIGGNQIFTNDNRTKWTKLVVSGVLGIQSREMKSP